MPIPLWLQTNLTTLLVPNGSSISWLHDIFGGISLQIIIFLPLGGNSQGEEEKLDIKQMSNSKGHHPVGSRRRSSDRAEWSCVAELITDMCWRRRKVLSWSSPDTADFFPTEISQKRATLVIKWTERFHHKGSKNVLSSSSNTLAAERVKTESTEDSPLMSLCTETCSWVELETLERYIQVWSTRPSTTLTFY